jgi:hypothetical protein
MTLNFFQFHQSNSRITISLQFSFTCLQLLPYCAVILCPSVVTGKKKKAGLIRKYGLNMSRQVFREKAAGIGFTKVSLLQLVSRHYFKPSNISNIW